MKLCCHKKSDVLNSQSQVCERRKEKKEKMNSIIVE